MTCRWKYTKSSSAPVIRNPHQYPLVYLKDVSYKYLDLVMQFIYLGECEVGHEELDQFLNTGKELRVKGLLDTLNPEENQPPPPEAKLFPSLNQKTCRT